MKFLKHNCLLIIFAPHKYKEAKFDLVLKGVQVNQRKLELFGSLIASLTFNKGKRWSNPIQNGFSMHLFYHYYHGYFDNI